MKIAVYHTTKIAVRMLHLVHVKAGTSLLLYLQFIMSHYGMILRWQETFLNHRLSGLCTHKCCCYIYWGCHLPQGSASYIYGGAIYHRMVLCYIYGGAIYHRVV